MATMDFPASPSTGDIHTHSGKRWQWDGAVWRAYSLAFTGTPVAPTAAADTNTTQIATTAYVQTELGDYLTTSTASSTYAPKASPEFTGNVTMQSLDMDDIVAGDVIYGSGADTLARLAKGSNDQVLTLASGVPSWADAAGGGGGTSIADADADTKIQVEESSDEDIIRFDVEGTQVATMAADVTTLEGNNNRTVQVKNTGGAYAYVTFQDTNTTAPSAGGGVTGANRVGCQTNDLVFYADGEEKGRFIADKGLTFNGDTAAANALDDYEEGTWTAAFTTGGGTIAPNTSYDTMNYTKIGRLVTVGGNVDGFTVSSPTGSLTMTGLPFAVDDTAERSDRTAFVVTARGLVSAEDNIFGQLNAGTGLVINYGNGSTGGGGAHMATIIDAGSYIHLSATYVAAT